MTEYIQRLLAVHDTMQPEDEPRLITTINVQGSTYGLVGAHSPIIARSMTLELLVKRTSAETKLLGVYNPEAELRRFVMRVIRNELPFFYTVSTMLIRKAPAIKWLVNKK